MGLSRGGYIGGGGEHTHHTDGQQAGDSKHPTAEYWNAFFSLSNFRHRDQ